MEYDVGEIARHDILQHNLSNHLFHAGEDVKGRYSA